MDPHHLASVVLTGGAGLGYLAAAVRRWLLLSRGVASGDGAWWWAFAVQTAGLAIALGDPGHRTFAYGALAAWAAVAAVMFAGRFLAAPVRLLLALPLGAVALLVAIAGSAAGTPPDDGSGHWIARLHAGFMAAHLAALVAAGGAGVVYLLAAARLKSADPLAMRLPALPVLERLIDRGLVWGAGLLIGGLAVGGAAMRVSDGFRLLHPTALIGIAELALLAAVLAVHRARRLSRRSLAIAAVACLLVGALGLASLVVVAHG